MITGLSHMTFIVKDLNKTEAMLVKLLGARKIYQSDDHHYSIAEERFYVAKGMWIAIMQGEPLPSKTYNHVAFKIDEDAINPCLEHLEDLGLEILPGRTRITGEGHSIYFYDYDNHLFELHTGTLEQRLETYAVA